MRSLQQQLASSRSSAQMAQASLQDEIDALTVGSCIQTNFIVVRAQNSLCLLMTVATISRQFSHFSRLFLTFISHKWFDHAWDCLRLLNGSDQIQSQGQVTSIGPSVRHCHLQASLAKERSGRAQIVASLKETISGLKAAGDVEGRLKAQAIALHGQVTAAQHAQVAVFLGRAGYPAGIC